MAEEREDKLAEKFLIDLAQDLKVNRDLLDEELITQPHNFFHVADRYALAISRRDAAKQAIETMEAHLDQEIRDELITEGEKVTDAKVEYATKRDQDYIRQQDKYLQAKLLADRWGALKAAYEQRSYALKDLVALNSAGYFGDVTGSNERRDAHQRFNSRTG